MMLGYVRSKGKQKPLLSMQPIPFFLCLFFFTQDYAQYFSATVANVGLEFILPR